MAEARMVQSYTCRRVREVGQRDTGAIWKVLKETELVAGGPSRGGRHTVPPKITAVFGRVKTTHEVPGTRAQPISGRPWQCSSISDWA